MEITETTNTQDVNVSTATNEESAVNTAGEAVNGEAQAQATEPAAYSPNFKYKVLDKEMEFDEFIRPSIKNAEHEKKLKELYEKAYGLDEVKKSRDQVRDEHKSYKAQWDPVIETVQKAYKAFHAKDYDMVFEALGIPEKTLQQHVLRKLQLEELPQQQKDMYNQQQDLRRQNMTMQEQLESYQTQFKENMAQQRTRELDFALQSPDAKAFQEAFDSRNGQGSFKSEVINQGIMKWNTSKQDVPPDQIIKELIQRYGFQAPQAQVQSQQVPSTATVAERKELPTIPVVKSSQSAVGKNLKTLSDLESVRKEKYGY